MVSYSTDDLSRQIWETDYADFRGRVLPPACDSPVSSHSDSTSSHFAPSPSPLSQPPVPRPSQSKKKRPGHITRPPNAFLIFRSDFWAREKQKPQPVERDHRDISRIAAHCWRSMDPATKQEYHNRAQQLRDLHRLQYPNYRLTPAPRRPRAPKQKSGMLIAAEARCLRIASSIIGTPVIPDQSSDLRSSHTALEYIQPSVTPITSHLSTTKAYPPFEIRASELAAPKPIHPIGYAPHPYSTRLAAYDDPQPLLSSDPCPMASLLDDLHSLPPLPVQTELELWPAYALQYAEPEAPGTFYSFPYQQVQGSSLSAPNPHYTQDSYIFDPIY